MTLVRRVRPFVKRSVQESCRVLASRPTSRYLLNFGYGLLSDRWKSIVHRIFAEIFPDQDDRLVEGEWRVRFNGATIRLPLRPLHARLDWVAALSILGHETEIKSTYARLLADTEHPIDVFFDVGANYGTHSILFASCGVETLAFEPNADCRPYFSVASALNQLKIRWVERAIGDHEGSVELVYPEGLTWLGSVATQVSVELLAQRQGCVTRRVELDLLDRYVDGLRPGQRVLLKIDVEGGELSVLRGARSLLQRSPGPVIIFESNDPGGRAELAGFLGQHHYRIFDLPFGPGPSLSGANFAASRMTNFIAVPAKE